jgi:hypothetical protein
VSHLTVYRIYRISAGVTIKDLVLR